MRNGINPLSGLLSGRLSSLNIPSNSKAPNFSNFDRNLIVMRSAGKSGLVLNDYSSFLEVTLARNEKYSVITDMKVYSPHHKLSNRLRSQFMTPFIPFLLDTKFRRYICPQINTFLPIWHPYRRELLGNTASVSLKRPIIRKTVGPNQIFVEQNIALRSGNNLLDSEGKLIEFDQEALPQIGAWPQRAWKVYGSDVVNLPETLEPKVIESATFIYSVNNLYHFIEDTLPQIELNNIESPEKLILMGGKLDSVLMEIAISSSLAPIKFVRDEEHQIIKNLTFFYLGKYRRDLAAGKKVELAEHANLIRECIARTALSYPQQDIPTEKIFIIRRKGLQRQLSNHKSVHATLRKRGFILIDFEDLSLSERISLLRKCRILVGESGAGLAHAYFLRPESRVVEIRHPSMDGSLEHETLVKTRVLNYSITSNSYTKSMSRFIHGKDSFKADLSELIRAIEE